MRKLEHSLDAAGEHYLHFVVTKVSYLAELNCTLRELVHTPSGAHIMHIGNDDPENLFCLSFRTLPSSSNGAPHILEHTVLCGSRRFPVKDPFFAMTRRSLNTYMNALTGSDFTCYPASSQVEKDFYNLLDVYIDAVFHPQLKKESFLQEGHRLEFSNPQDPKSPLEFKGIVFNEMKGSLASSDSRLWHAMMKHLIPDLPYAFNSGGDPEEIPTLTYPELIAFHEAYYHPSRCLFFFYGNLPLKQHLDFIEDKILKTVQKAPSLPPIPKQTRFSSPKTFEMRYPINEMEDHNGRAIIAIGWLTTPLLQQDEVLALSVLDTILMESDASPLKRRLLESKLCIHADAYMDVEMSEIPYVIVFKGCDSQHAKAIEHMLLESLEEIVSEGIPSSLLEAAIHQLELSRLEITGDHAPFGLTLFMRSALAKQHGCDPENALLIHALFEKLLTLTKDPDYLPNLIRTYLIHNTHRVCLVMHPDPHLAAEEAEEERKKLQNIQRNLTEADISHILKQAEELKNYQKSTEQQSIDCLPKVTLDDVSPEIRNFPLRHYTHGPLEIFHHECFTNHILYADMIFDLPPIADEDLPYVSLLVSLIPEIGSGPRDYAENLDYIQAHTGGIAAACALHLQVTDLKKARPSFSLRGKALYNKADKLFALMRDTLLSPDLDDRERISDLIEQLHEAQVQRLTRQAMRYAIQLASSNSSSASYVGEAWSGLRYFKTIESLAKDLKANLSWLIERLIRLKNELFTFQHPQLVLSCSKEALTSLANHNFFGMAELPSRSASHWELDYPVTPLTSQGRSISSQVAFSAEVFETIPYIHPHSAGLTLAAVLCENKILHKRIREEGGAYGCGATFSANTGQFYFHAFRDPRIAHTRQVFHAAIHEIASGHFSDRDLEEAKLGVIQHLDLPLPPGSRAITAYGWYRMGKTNEMRQQFRDRLLALKSEEVAHIVTTHLLPKKDTGIFITLAGTDLLEKENKIFAEEGKTLPIFPLT